MAGVMAIGALAPVAAVGRIGVGVFHGGPVKALLVVFSYHHDNTRKIAKVFAEALGAPTTTPQEVDPNELSRYDLVGFGSGIYDEKHHQSLLDLADRLAPAAEKRAFIFSTSSIQEAGKVARDHSLLKEKLQARHYKIVGEFSCRGFNTNSFLRFFGGINRGRPDAEDLERAMEFARNLEAEGCEQWKR
jgi:flavodoxin